MQSARTGFTLVEIMIVVVMIGMLASMTFPFYEKARLSAQKSTCINNLRQIENAKEQWAIAAKVNNGEPSDTEQINRYIQNPPESCPGGGTYLYGPVGVNPTCSLGPARGHTL